MRRLLPVMLVVSLGGFGIGDLEEGNRLYREGRYAEAAVAYREAIAQGESSPELHYNLGTALLQLGQFDQAEAEFRAALDAVDPELRHRALYNLGSRFLLAGRAAAEPAARTTLLDAAVEAYKHALRLAPQDGEAKWNYEMALRERDEEQEPPPPQEGGGGGGGGGDEQEQSQSGGAGSDRANATPGAGAGEDQRAPAGEGAMSRQQAEQILGAIEQQERELYRESLRRSREPRRTARNW